MKTTIRHFLFLFLLFASSISKSQPNAWTHYFSGNSPLPSNSVQCIAFENDSTTWIGTDFGLAKLSAGVWTIYNTGNSGIGANDIRSIAIDSNHVKWIGTFSNGVSVFNDTTFTILNTFNSSLPDDYVRSLAVDDYNSKWIGTIGGLAKLDSLNNWTIYTMWNSVLGSNNIASIYVDASTNDKWAGTINGGLFLIEKDTNLSSFTTQNSGISDNTILGIDMDAAKNLFLSSPANGLILKLSGFGWLTFNTVSSTIPTAGLTSVALNSIGQPWIGTITHGLLLKNGNNFIIYDTSNTPLTDNYIQCLKMSSNQKLWIGTQTGGVFILDPSLLTGIPNINANYNVDVYPNPTSDQLHITCNSPISKVEIFDLQGRMMLRQMNPLSSLSLGYLQPGVYQLRVFIGEDVVVKKIVLSSF